MTKKLYEIKSWSLKNTSTWFSLQKNKNDYLSSFHLLLYHPSDICPHGKVVWLNVPIVKYSLSLQVS